MVRLWQRIGSYISLSLFRLVFFFGITLVSLAIILTSPQHIKDTFIDAKLYDNFVSEVLQDSSKNAQTSSIPLNNPRIQQIIESAFSSEVLKHNTEIVIDSLYNWLGAKTPTPVFRADLSAPRQQVADAIASYAFDRLRTLPTCFAVPETVDPFTAGCQPPYTDLNLEQSKLSQQISGPNGILPKAVFTEKDLPKDKQGIIIYQKYSYAPQIYHWLKLSPWIVSIILVLLASLMILFEKSKRRAIQRLAVAIVSSSIALLITPVIFNFILPHFSKSIAFSTDTARTQQLFNSISSELTSDFYSNIINISLQLLTVGIIVLVIERFTRPNTGYLDIKKRSGLASSDKRKLSKSRNYKPKDIPIQSSNSTASQKSKHTKNKKYRKIPKGEV